MQTNRIRMVKKIDGNSSTNEAFWKITNDTRSEKLTIRARAAQIRGPSPAKAVARRMHTQSRALIRFRLFIDKP